MRQLEPLALAEKQHLMLADHIPAAHHGKSDLAVRTPRPAPRARKAGLLLEPIAARARSDIAQCQGAARGGVALAAMMAGPAL